MTRNSNSFRCILAAACFLVAASRPAYSQLVISQVYGGGGNAGATWKNDFIEVFNKGVASVSLAGYSVQYGGATASTWAVTSLGNSSLAPGRYFLIQEAAGANLSATSLPAPDATGAIAMSATAGKVALVSSSTALLGACPVGGALVDLVGYGPTANCFEGTAMAALSNTTSGLRAAAGCTDSNVNSSDFSATASITPRNTATTANPCSGGGGSNPSATGSASVNPVTAGNSTTLSAVNSPGANPPSVSYTDTCNLTAIGGGSSVTLPVSYSVPVATAPATYGLPCTVTDDQARSTTFTLSLTVQAPPPAFKNIYQITGAGTASPLAGTPVETRGVVTALRGTTGTTKGFYIESVTADRDNDPNTSEGLLVFTGSTALPACAVVGNNIQIDGTVTDFIPSTAPAGSVPLTELNATSNCQILGTSALGSLPAGVTVDSAAITAAGSANQARKYVGMRVTMANVSVVGPSTGNLTETSATATVANNFWVSAAGISRPFHNTAGIQATRRPSDAAGTVPSWNGNPEAIKIDSTGLTGGANYELAVGSTVASIDGIMDYDTSGGQYQIYTNAAGIGIITPSSPALAATPIPAPLSSDLLIVDANIERFYNTINDGGDVVLTATAYQGRLNKLSLAIRNVMRMPDIIALEEVEGPKSTAISPAYPVLTDIVNKLNSDAASNGQGSPNYSFCGGVTNDVGLIAPAAIYRQDRVTALECGQYGITTTYSTPGGGTSILNDRPPVVFRASVRATGSDSSLEVRMVVNHLRSLNGIDAPGAGNGDRVRTKRNEQAKYLANLVTGNLGSEQSVNWNLTDNLLVAGDMNAFDVNDGYSDSVNCIAGSPAPASQIYATAAQLAVSSACTAVATLALTNLTTTDPAQRYSYSFSGIAQRIDHVLVSSKLNPRVRQTVYVRNNADFPEGPTYRNDFNRPERYSDHDAPAVYLKLPVEVTSRSRVNASALLLNRATGRYKGTITVTNTGAAAFTGPVYVFFTLPAGVTLPDLPQANGLPYATINLPAGLAAGATSGSVAVSFANPANARISYTTSRYDVNF